MKNLSGLRRRRGSHRRRPRSPLPLHASSPSPLLPSRSTRVQCSLTFPRLAEQTAHEFLQRISNNRYCYKRKCMRLILSNSNESQIPRISCAAGLPLTLKSRLNSLAGFFFWLPKFYEQMNIPTQRNAFIRLIFFFSKMGLLQSLSTRSVANFTSLEVKLN